MADSITARTMFFDTRNGQIRFHDWNRIDTTLGTMMEPRQLIELRQARASAFNPNDQCAKITALEIVDLRGIDILLSDKKKIMVNGNQVPRVYSF